MATVADYLVETLVNAGIKRIYGIVGDSLNPVTDALRRDGRIEWIHVRHEEVAAFAAGAEAQLTGSLVVCAGSCGPGNLHLINGLYDCHRSGAPVLAIASHIATSEIGTSYFQETHPTALFAECSYYCELVSTPQQMPRVLHLAMQAAVSKCGVGVVVLPGDVAGLDAPDNAPAITLAHGRSTTRPTDDALRACAELINAHDNITVFAGIGAASARNELFVLADNIKAPIAYTYRSKEALEYDNPFSVGMTGLLGWGAAYEAMHSCDVLLLLGTDFPYEAFLPTGCHIVQVDIAPERLGRRAALDVGLCGDVQATLGALLPLLEPKTDSTHLDDAKNKHAKAFETLQAYVERGPEHSPIRPEYVAATLNELAADDAIFTMDTGTPVIWAARYIRASKERRFLGSFNHGSMANAMPQALGAALAYPERQVIALAGDGGFSMLLGDLITIVQYQLPVKIVVFNNSQLDFVNLEMRQAGLPPWKTDLWNPNFAAVAQAIGASGVRIEDPSALRDNLASALAAPGPAVIDIVVDGNALSLPPHITIGQAEGFALSMAKQMLVGQASDVITTVARNIRLRPQ